MAVIGGEVLARMLAAEGVDTVFGIVDGTYLGLLAGLERHRIRLISPRHETSAAHMAGAYARLTGKLGVCIASNGPGVANVLPGVAVEQVEANRVLLITSARRTGIIRPDRGGGYQYFDQAAAIRPISKWSETATSAARLPELFRKALRAAWRGRPGVVHLDVPEDLMNGPSDLVVEPVPPESYRRTHPVLAPASQLAEVVALLRAAERPTIHAGSGILWSGRSKELAELAALLDAPVTTSWAARAALPDSDPHHIPVPALEVVDEARRSADVVLILGGRLGETDWWGKAPYWGRPGEQRIIQVDLDEEALGLHRTAAQAVHADLAAFLPALIAALRAEKPDAALSQTRRKRLAGLGEKRKAALEEIAQILQAETEWVHSARVPQACRQAFGDDAIFVIDGGNAAVWAMFCLEVRATNSILGTWKMGMLGAGVAQALGAKVAAPQRPVCCIIGDGAMGFHPQEVETAVRAGLPVVYVVLVDKQWGMVKLTQQMALSGLREAMGSSGEGTLNADLGEIAWDALAASMGAYGARVSTGDALLPALQAAIASGRPAVLHVDVDPALHLWAPGLQAFKAMHQEPQG